MSNRFYVDTTISSDQVTLAGAQAHHLLHVMRATAGDEVVLFDGSGTEYRTRVVRIGRSAVELTVIDSAHVDRESPCAITVGVALPKGDRQRWLVEKLVELGVLRLVPLRTQRSVVHPDSRAMGKLQRAVIEASKQCGRNRLMGIEPLQTLQDYISSGSSEVSRWLADPSGERVPRDLSDSAVACIAIGPEGGFADEELEMARSAGWRIVNLGRRILRIETAALVMATLAGPGRMT